MKRIVLSVLLAAGLLVSTTLARPAPPASADVCDSTTLVVVVSVVSTYFFGVPAGVLVCGGPGLGITGTQVCAMGDVDVTVSSTNGDHVYQYTMGDGHGGGCNLQISASYSPTTDKASEKLSGDKGTVEAIWSCPADPWVYLPGQAPACTHLSVEAKPDDQGFDLSHSVLPFTVQLLSDQGRHVLAAQLQNAIKEAAPPYLSAPINAHSGTCLVCGALEHPADPTVPVLPDLAITRISGDQTPVQGTVNTYEVVLANLGARPQSQVQVEIQVTGSLLSFGLTQTPTGFSCSGTSTIFCTGPLGGYGDAPISTSVEFQLQAFAAGTGLGSVSATADPANVIQESNENNNAQTLAVTVK